MMLTKRLAACAAQVTPGGVICDVGTDHAYLPAELLRQNRCTRAVATDIHAGPLEAARRTLTEAGVLSRAELHLCDGLEQIQPGDITDVVIAGMGSETILHILGNCPWRRQVHFILQPMTKIPVLRQWLVQQCFFWTEEIVQEGEKFYVVMSVSAAESPVSLTPLELEIGCVKWQSETVRRYAAWKQQRFQKLAQQLHRAGRTESETWAALSQEIETRLQMEHNGKGEALC